MLTSASREEENSNSKLKEDEIKMVNEEKRNECGAKHLPLIKQISVLQSQLNTSDHHQQQQHAEYVNSTLATPTTINNNNTNINDNSSFDSTVNFTKLIVNLFQWEQLVSKGVSRPLLINDLDFTDLRDEDDGDLMNAGNASNTNGNSKLIANQTTTTTTSNLHNSQKSGPPPPPLVEGPNGQQSLVAQTPPPPMPPPKPCSWLTSVSTTPPPPPPAYSNVALQTNQSAASFISCSPSPPQPPPPPEMSVNQQTNLKINNNLTEMNNQEQSSSSAYSSNYSSGKSSAYSSAQLENELILVKNKILKHSEQENKNNNNISATPQAPLMMSSLRGASSMSSLLFGGQSKNGNKRKKTMKLFWKEVREDRSLLSKLTRKKTIWDDLKPVHLDTQRLEHLFESKAKDVLLSRSRIGLDGMPQRKVKITVLDAKRSNAINIGMTKLPPMRTIKSAILKMDSSIMNREGIEKILSTMMPTEEEKSRIIEAQLANPDTPLGTAEQFLLNLASISALEARLKLWAFQLDYAQIEKEVAEPLMDLKQAIEEIEKSETFRNVLATLLAIGNFLNSSNAKGFQIEYLEKVPEVKDTVHKHSLLHHLCLFIQEKYDPELAHDLYSEFSAVNRASKVDYAEVAKSLKKMQQDCKASWDYLKIVAKHDGLANLMNTSPATLSSSSSAASGQNSTSSSASSTTTTDDSHSLLGGGRANSPLKSTTGKLNNLSKLSMITTVVSSDNNNNNADESNSSSTGPKQLKMKVSDFLTDCAERIMVLVVIHRRVMNRFQKLLVYLGCPSHQIKQTQPQQILKIINEFALEYRTKRERVRELLAKRRHQALQQQQNAHFSATNRWQLNRTNRWAGSQQCISSQQTLVNSSVGSGFRPSSTASSCADSICCGMSLISGGCETPQHSQLISSNNYPTLSNNNNNNNRINSPSAYSQVSNYSYDYQQQAMNESRHQSVTPTPENQNHLSIHDNSLSYSNLAHNRRFSGSTNRRSRPHSMMSVCMFSDQMQKQDGHQNGCSAGADWEQRERDEQLRRLLGGGKSLDESCNELFQLGHWSSSMARVTRHPPNFHGQTATTTTTSKLQQRAVSMDESSGNQNNENEKENENENEISSINSNQANEEEEEDEETEGEQEEEEEDEDGGGGGGESDNNYNGETQKHHQADVSRQSSYYKYLRQTHGHQFMDNCENQEDNSDEEILRSLVRAATAKSNNSHHHNNNHNHNHLAAGKNADERNRILSRISCDRKSIKRTFPNNRIELSNVG